MRRHWQHTSFCMGQCVSSCGSKRTLDSVPTTPDTENYPGLIPSGKIIHRKNSSSAIEDQDALTFQQKPKSSAAKFVTAFSQRRITTRRINPEGESPVHINKSSIQSGRPFLPISDSVIFHHGDMKDSTVKNYFRETISSAKKTSSKSVTFSEVSPAGTASRKKSFFSFHKSKGTKTVEQEPHVESSPSRGLSKATRKRSKNSGAYTLPTFVRPLKEKQVCRVTLSPKHGTTVVNVELKENRSPILAESDSFKKTTNGNDGASDSIYVGGTSTSRSQAMGNASSSSQGLVVEAVKTIKPIVKSNSITRSKCQSIDVNENNTNTNPCTVFVKKSGESPGVTRKGSKKWLPVPNNESGNVLRNINSIKEENRLLRLKFFLEDNSENSASTLETVSSSGGSSLDTNSKMSRHNLLHNKSAIPLPKSSTARSGSNTSSIPKLYSVPSSENETIQSSADDGTNSRLKSVQKVEPPQPTNLGKWVPAADFFQQPSHTTTITATTDKQPHTSPTTSKNTRRSSEPPRWMSSVSSSGPSKVTRDVRGPDAITERRGTIAHYQQRKPTGPSNLNVGNVPKLIKSSLIPDKNAGMIKNIPTKVSIRKPEETKPFYTIGLYQNRPKPTEPLKTFGVHQGGFHGVSTGIVRQRTQQYQSKVGEVPKLHSNLKDSALEQRREERGCMQGTTSPMKPGVMRSATYTIRKHGILEEEHSGEHREHRNKPVAKAKSDVDPRYLTWTVRKPGTMTASKGSGLPKNTHRQIDQRGLSQNDQTRGTEYQIPSGLLSPMGYPLQHNPSGTSTSSMGTNEDGTGDHVVISDSEYLIDDEISDQPDLTLTFKDSSLKLSSSSSGESLLSDIMLDHLDLNQDRILLGELTSDSAISDVSSHKHVSKSSCDQVLKQLENNKIKNLEQSCTKIPEKAISPNETTSPSSVRTVRHLKSPRRISKPTSAVTKPSGQPNVEINPLRSSSSIRKSPSTTSTANTSIKLRTTPDKKPTLLKSIQGKNSSQSSASLSPINRTRSPKEQVVGLTVENVNKLHKQYELANSQYSIVDDRESNAVPFAEELLVEFQDLKDELEKLRLQLETQEQRERDKDELILRLTSEVERLKSSKIPENKTLISPDSEHEETSSEKERYINSMNYENAAVQTENNNIFNRSVTYPEEDDKYGELVSFRIGRSSSLKKKL